MCNMIHLQVISWGHNGHGQLGNNTTSGSYLPIKVSGHLGMFKILTELGIIIIKGISSEQKRVCVQTLYVGIFHPMLSQRKVM